MTDAPSLMETVKERLATKYGDKAVVKIDPQHPDQAEVVFRDGKGSVRGSLSTQGNSVTMKFDGLISDLDPQRVKDFDGRIKGVFERPPLGVASTDIRCASRAEGNQSITTRLQPSEVEAAKASVVEHRAKVTGTIKTFHEQENMRANGIAEPHVTAQTNHSLARLNAADDPRSLMHGKAPESPIQAATRAGVNEFHELVHGKPAAPATAPVSQLPANSNPDFLELLKKPFAPKEHVVAPASETIHVKGGNAIGGPLVKAGIAIATAAVGGVAAAAEAPEGHRTEAFTKAAVKSGKEQFVPGSTETDMCKKIGAVAEYGGAAIAGGLTAAAIGTGTVVTAIPSGGGSVALAATTGAAAVGVATVGGGMLGKMLGENACNLARDAINAISAENRAMMVHKATPSMQAADTARAAQPAQGAAAGRG